MRTVGQLGSTKPHRDAQRINAMCELLGCTLGSVSQVATIPTSTAQAIVSISGMWRQTMKPHERILHVAQGLLASSHTALSIALLFSADTSSYIAHSIIIIDLLYQGILLTGWIPAELVREQGQPATPVIATAPNTNP